MKGWKKVVKKAAAALVLALGLAAGAAQTPLTRPAVVLAATSYTYTYYPKCSSSVKTLVKGLKEIGVNSSYSNRKSIAKLNGYSNYRGTASQNNALLRLLKKGKLIKSRTAKTTTITSQNTRTIADGTYMIQSGNSSSRVLDIHNWSLEDCGNLETYNKNGTTNQLFRITYVGSGYYKIIALHSNLALDVAGGSSSSGANAQQYTWNGSSAQLWKFESAGNGYYYIHSKLGKYLDNANGSTTPGNNVQLYSFNGSAAQKWKFVSVSPNPIADGTYMIESGNSSNRVLDINNWSQANGGNLETYQKNGTSNQIFNVTYVGDGYYKIIASHSGKALDVSGGNSSSGANCHQWEWNNTSAQLWQFISAGNGYYYIRSKLGTYLDNYNGSTTLGNNVWLYSYNGSAAQKWKFVKSSQPDSTLSISGQTDPPSQLTQGSGHTVKGTVSSNYKITKIVVGVYTASGATVTEKTVYPNAYSYNLNTIDSDVHFGRCTAGVNVYKVVASDEKKSNCVLQSVSFTVVGKGVQLDVPSYKQYDSRWGSTKIGTKTIKQVGCLITSLAMKYSYHRGTTVYPDAMKNKLSFSNNDLYWSSVTALGYTVTGSYGCSITNSIMSTIYNQLRAGKPVIIGGQKSSGGTHWVIVTGYTGTSTTSFNSADFKINDPNASRTTLKQFLTTYPTVLRLIY